MKRFLTIVILIIGLGACNNQSEQTNKVHSQSDQKDYSDTLSELDDYELEEQKMEKEMAQQRKDHEIRMVKKEFSFQSTDNCESGGPSIETLNKYKKRTPFNIKKIKSDTNCVVRFRFIDDCCLEYVGDIKRNSDLIKLSYKNISYMPCDCYCEYEYTFDFKIAPNNPVKIELNGKQL
ncbi:hypothetical protein [Crocinitomix catalasitica]|uniref:hypothetical protein n=1 Tax=Crocinitomix catalasitica TaxID=184607 RepID=UPI000489CA8B|nr:hypothetical protein [Crocinitomix catalasitica]